MITYAHCDLYQAFSPLPCKWKGLGTRLGDVHDCLLGSCAGLFGGWTGARVLRGLWRQELWEEFWLHHPQDRLTRIGMQRLLWLAQLNWKLLGRNTCTLPISEVAWNVDRSQVQPCYSQLSVCQQAVLTGASHPIFGDLHWRKGNFFDYPLWLFLFCIYMLHAFLPTLLYSCHVPSLPRVRGQEDSAIFTAASIKAKSFAHIISSHSCSCSISSGCPLDILMQETEEKYHTAGNFCRGGGNFRLFRWLLKPRTKWTIPIPSFPDSLPWSHTHGRSHQFWSGPVDLKARALAREIFLLYEYS